MNKIILSIIGVLVFWVVLFMQNETTKEEVIHPLNQNETIKTQQLVTKEEIIYSLNQNETIKEQYVQSNYYVMYLIMSWKISLSWTMVSLSPDGKKIAYIISDKKTVRLMVNNKSIWNQNYEEISDVVFSHDSKNILFIAKKSNNRYVMVFNWRESKEYDSINSIEMQDAHIQTLISKIRDKDISTFMQKISIIGQTNQLLWSLISDNWKIHAYATYNNGIVSIYKNDSLIHSYSYQLDNWNDNSVYFSFSPNSKRLLYFARTSQTDLNLFEWKNLIDTYTFIDFPWWPPKFYGYYDIVRSEDSKQYAFVSWKMLWNMQLIYNWKDTGLVGAFSDIQFGGNDLVFTHYKGLSDIEFHFSNKSITFLNQERLSFPKRMFHMNSNLIFLWDISYADNKNLRFSFFDQNKKIVASYNDEILNIRQSSDLKNFWMINNKKSLIVNFQEIWYYQEIKERFFGNNSGEVFIVAVKDEWGPLWIYKINID